MKKKFLFLFLVAAILATPPVVSYASESAIESEAPQPITVFDTDSHKLVLHQSAVTADYLGQPSIVLLFSYTNTASMSQIPTMDFSSSVVQNGMNLFATTIPNNELSSYFSNAYAWVESGDTVAYCLAYTLSDFSDVELRVSDGIGEQNAQCITISLPNVNLNSDSSQNGTAASSNEIIDKLIHLHNSASEKAITNISPMDIQGADRRTEFRLTAFNNAVGKKGILDDSNINIVNYGTRKNDCLRVYFHARSYDTATEVCTTLIHIFSNAITDEEINEKYNVLVSMNTDINLYFDTDNSISGYINRTHEDGEVNGYDLMLDCSKLDYMMQSEASPSVIDLSPTPEPTAVPESPAAQNETMVWVSGNGSRYHSNSNCSNMSSPSEISLSDAEASGYEPCKKCY